MPELPKSKPVDRGSVVSVSHRLGTPQMDCPEWLKATPKEDIPQPERLAFTPPQRGEGLEFGDAEYAFENLSYRLPHADGQFILPVRPASEPKPETDHRENKALWGINNNLSTIRKRGYETNGTDGS